MLTSPNTMPQEFAPQLATRLLMVPQANLLFARWAKAAIKQANIKAVNPGGWSVVAEQIKAGAPIDAGSRANLAEALGYGEGGHALGQYGELVYPDLIQYVQSDTGKGTNVLINRPKLISSDATIASRRLQSADSFFGNSTQALEMEQVSVTIYEVAGPLKAGALAPIGLDLFTQITAWHDQLENAQVQLTYDRNFYLDKLIPTLLKAACDKTGQTVYGGGNTATSQFVTQGGDPFEFNLLPDIAKQFYNAGVPGIGGMPKWILVLHQNQLADLQKDPTWQRQTVFTKPAEQMNPIYPGYIAETANFIICVSNNLDTLANIGVNANLTGYVGYAMAPGVLGYGAAMHPRMLRDKNDDGGRKLKIGWHCAEGWSVLDDRFVVDVITT